MKNLPDLYYNRAMAYKHMEEYKFAIAGFHTALCLEPGLREGRLTYVCVGGSMS